MKKLITSVALMCMVLILSGCSTILTRGDWGYFSPGKETAIYPSTVMDSLFFYGIFTIPFERDWYIDAPCRPILLIGTAVDFAPSIISDTVMLPYDLQEMFSSGTKNK